MSDEESVVEQDKAVSEEPATEAGAQEDDLDALLSEFETETKSESDAKSDDEDVKAKVTAIERRIAQDEFQKVVSNIKGNLDVEDDFVEGWLEVKARKSQALASAYANRHSNPQQWAKVEKTLQKELSQRFPKAVDEEATEIHQSVTAAVRGASTKAPASDDDVPADISSWPQHKFEAWLKEQGRKHG